MMNGGARESVARGGGQRRLDRQAAVASPDGLEDVSLTLDGAGRRGRAPSDSVPTTSSSAKSGRDDMFLSSTAEDREPLFVGFDPPLPAKGL